MSAGLPRRRFLQLAAAAAAVPALPRRLFAALPRETPLHGLSPFGDLKYPPGFARFDYASPEAPTGGTFNFAPPNWAWNQNTQTFNTLNSLAAKGDSPPRMELCFDTLMTRALDEPDALYGLLAESVSIGADGRSYTFRLRPEARFHDGTPLTAEDAAFTFMLLKEKGYADIRVVLLHLEAAEAVGPAELRLQFDGKHSERTILAAAALPILSKAFYTAYPFDSSELRAPLGSGPYKVGLVTPGSTIEYQRVADYWGRDLPVNRGFNHFDRIRIDFYRDRQAGFEAFKKGEVLFREEFTSKTWATEYDFPALAAGKVIKRTFPAELRPSLQAWAVNTRRKQFQDVRVREAIGLCFDFEWTKRNLFYGSYTRSDSLFEKSPFKAEGQPSAGELALLERHRTSLPPEAFGDPIRQPVSDGSGRDRKLLGRAVRLLAEAGWKRQGGLARNEAGETLALEMLVNDPVFVRVDSPFIENLRTVGFDASIRLVDETQYTLRQSQFDFDMLSMALTLSASPTRDSLEDLFGSGSANAFGSKNLPGTADPIVDALIEAAGRADTRADLETAMRALDRVLRARRDWIPNWYLETHRAAFWDVFGFREPKPDYGFPVETLWWWDEEKAAKLGKA